MSDRIAADLTYDRIYRNDIDSMFYHIGDASEPLRRWQQLLSETIPHGWSEVQKHAKEVMRLIADPRVLFRAATALRANGPKAPGPNGLPLECLTRTKLWEMCSVLGKAIASDRYRPGDEYVVHALKTSGVGRRPIIVSDVQDRVVAKAASLVLRPMLDCCFDPLSFAFRPQRTREQGLAIARLLRNSHPIWLTHDLKDAFGRVPLNRLLDIIEKRVPCPRLSSFLGHILPPQSRSLSGIKQGGPLSPLMLELYLTHVLHRPWRKEAMPVHLLRYADDLLIVAPDRETSEVADAKLRKLLIPAGMMLKANFKEAVADICEQPTEWIGYRCQRSGSKLTIRLSENNICEAGPTIHARSYQVPSRRASVCGA